MKRIAVLSMIALLPLLSACHTIQGMGQDITAIGRGVERSTK